MTRRALGFNGTRVNGNSKHFLERCTRHENTGTDLDRRYVTAARRCIRSTARFQANNSAGFRYGEDLAFFWKAFRHWFPPR